MGSLPREVLSVSCSFTIRSVDHSISGRLISVDRFRVKGFYSHRLMLKKFFNIDNLTYVWYILVEIKRLCLKIGASEISTGERGNRQFG